MKTKEVYRDSGSGKFSPGSSGSKELVVTKKEIKTVKLHKPQSKADEIKEAYRESKTETVSLFTLEDEIAKALRDSDEQFWRRGEYFGDLVKLRKQAKAIAKALKDKRFLSRGKFSY